MDCVLCNADCCFSYASGCGSTLRFAVMVVRCLSCVVIDCYASLVVAVCCVLIAVCCVLLCFVGV